jgi:hypothetical protein
MTLRCLCAGLALIGLLPLTCGGAVDHIVIEERQSFADGTAFGAVGPYEKLRGRAFFVIDPKSAANRPIVDLDKAPRDARGLVRFSSEFLLLRPVAPAAGNGTLIYEVNNRGAIAILGQIGGHSPARNDPTTIEDAGNRFLMNEGFTLLWSAWTWDVDRSPESRSLVLAPPIAEDHGKPVTGRVAYEFIVDEPSETARFTGNLAVPYRFAVPDDPGAVLTRRSAPDANRLTVPREAWQFVPRGEGKTPFELRLAGGFQPGTLYELVYRARDPSVVGLGLAGIRDLLSWVRRHPVEGSPVPQRTLAFGISQSGRVIQTMLLNGLHVDEAGNPVFDGAFIHVAGAGKGSFNHRFAMPTRHMSNLEEHGYPTDYFPFTTTMERDPVTGVSGSVLDMARRQHAVPKLFYVNTSAEYWNRAASLVTTDPGGVRDVPTDPRARIYTIAGAQHYVGRARQRWPYANCVNPLNHYVAMRALFLALDRWVRDGTEPPASATPSVKAGTLISVEEYRRIFPRLPGLSLPETNLRPPRLDLGPRFARAGIVDVVPPRTGKPFNTLVPRPDDDGTDQDGVRLPEVAVPLGTRLGWNTRSPAAGFPWATARWDGSFLPFARTESERIAAGDPRPSIESRYASRDVFVQRIREAARVNVRQGFMRADEVEAVVAAQASLFDRIMSHDPADSSCAFLYDN